MNYTEQYISVQGRDVIVSKNLKDVVQEKDINSEKVKITMDRFYDGEDFDAKQVSLYIRNPIYEEVIVDLNTVKTVEENKLIFDFIFTEEMTKYTGWLDMVFVVTSENYKWQSKQANKAVFIGGNFFHHEQPVPPAYFVDLEVYRQEILSYVAQARDYSVDAANEVVRASQEVDRAAAEVVKAKTEVSNAKAEVVKAQGEVVKAKVEADRAGSAAADAVSGAYEYIDKMVTFDNVSQANFNFNGRKVVPDGLIYENRIINAYSRIDTKINVSLTQSMVLLKTEIQKLTGNGFLFGQYSSGNGFELTQMVTGKLRLTIGGDQSIVVYSTRSINMGSNIIIFMINNGIITVFVNGEVFIATKANIIPNSLTFGIGGSSGTSGINVDTLFKDALIYNRTLIPQEQQHNLQVLNNSESIDFLSVTDKGGASKNFILATDEDHVSMSTNRTLRQEYMGVLKTMGKEFTSTDGSNIAIENGIEARLISGEIQGKTIKNYCSKKASEFTRRYGGNVSFDLNNNSMTMYSVTSDGAMDIYLTQLESDKVYTVVTNILTNLSDAPFNILHATGISLSNVAVPKGTTGLFKRSFKTANPITANVSKAHIYYGITGGEDKIIALQGYLILEGDWTTKPDSELLALCKNATGGLNSTKAIINNNDQSYEIYEPTIKGKTRILKAQKGTQNWVEISDSEVRDMTAYDYKLESINGDLGSVATILDVVDRSNNLKYVNTIEVILSGDESWIKNSTVIDGYTAFTYKPTDLFLSNTMEQRVISNLFPYEYSFNPINHIHANTSGINITIKNSELSSTDVVGFKQWLKAHSVSVRHQISTTQTTQLTDEQMKSYDAYKKIVSLSMVDNVSDILELKEYGSNVVTIKNECVGLYDLTWRIVNEGSVNYYFESIKPSTYYVLGKIISNIFEQADIGNTTTSIGIYCTPSYLRIRPSATQPTMEEFVIMLKEKEASAMYQLATPIISYIPKEIVPTIPTNKINNLSVGDAVNPSSFKFNIPVDKVSELETELKRISAIVGSLSNTKLISNYVNDEYSQLKERDDEYKYANINQ